MPYSAEHKQKSRERIVETARVLFNVHGFRGVTIDMVMQAAGLTRGAFYNHFKNKEALFEAAVIGFLTGRGATWRDEAGIDPSQLSPIMAQHMLDAYLSEQHLLDLKNQCPMIALPSDVARSSEQVQRSYQILLEAMVGLFENSIDTDETQTMPCRQRALAMAALCVGGMILARTLPDSDLAKEVRTAAHCAATKMGTPLEPTTPRSAAG